MLGRLRLPTWPKHDHLRGGTSSAMKRGAASEGGRPSSGGTRSWIFAGFSEGGDVQRLVVQESDFTNADGELVLGRNADLSHLVVADMTVSGAHGRFRINAVGDLEVADLESTNGTAINGVMLSSGTWQRLTDGDLVSQGGTELRVFIYDG